MRAVNHRLSAQRLSRRLAWCRAVADSRYVRWQGARRVRAGWSACSAAGGRRAVTPLGQLPFFAAAVFHLLTGTGGPGRPVRRVLPAGLHRLKCASEARWAGHASSEIADRRQALRPHNRASQRQRGPGAPEHGACLQQKRFRPPRSAGTGPADARLDPAFDAALAYRSVQSLCRSRVRRPRPPLPCAGVRCAPGHVLPR